MPTATITTSHDTGQHTASPTTTQPTYAASKPDKGFFVTQEMTSRLVAACPGHDYRMIVLLCRYGGLRCPSEVLSLRWADILRDENRMIVRSPKTEHHPGTEFRLIPIVPELLDQLRECFELAPAGAVYVVDSRYRAGSQEALLPSH